MNQLLTESKNKIENMIYEVRGKQVMLASDVAKLYNSEVNRINEVVKRNSNRFPEEFCFQLSSEEYKKIKDEISLRSQNATLENVTTGKGKYPKYLPYVFTEHGIMMLSGLLKSDIAARVNIQIINAFVEMRKYIANNNYDKRLSNIEIKLIEHDNSFKELFDKF